VCVWALAAANHELACHHALSRERWRIDRARGVYGALLPPDRIAAEGFGADDLATVEAMRRKAFVGDASGVAARLRALASELQLEELVINTWAHDPAARRDSYALLASAFELVGATSAATRAQP